MRSGKNSKSVKIRFEAKLSSLPNCCGVGMIIGHRFVECRKEQRLNWITRRWRMMNVWTPVSMEKKINTRILSRELFRQGRRAFKNYDVVYVALPQNTVSYRQITEWYEKHGFKLENEATSKHGNYKIKVLSAVKQEWNKKYAL